MSSVVRAFTNPKSPTFTVTGLSKQRKKILDGYIAKRRKRKSCYAGNLKPLAKMALSKSMCDCWALFKVTPDLRGCPRGKNSYARRFKGKHGKLYIVGKLKKCKFRKKL